ncbi:hypothetical protein [Microtetraspora niveoalba]|uniref:hypothetical protein n=1 Tax=Microtetraspora niveoalba TaxID=46175 RepID=UPI00082F4443|nr:hypothetical protein [Microtetraspora niveoalba]
MSQRSVFQRPASGRSLSPWWLAAVLLSLLPHTLYALGGGTIDTYVCAPSPGGPPDPVYELIDVPLRSGGATASAAAVAALVCSWTSAAIAFLLPAVLAVPAFLARRGAPYPHRTLARWGAAVALAAPLLHALPWALLPGECRAGGTVLAGVLLYGTIAALLLVASAAGAKPARWPAAHRLLPSDHEEYGPLWFSAAYVAAAVMLISLDLGARKRTRPPAARR